jgi:hypothetical protein
LYHPDLTPTDCRVFCALDRFDGANCFPSHAALGERIRASEDTSQRAIKRLVAVGAVRVEKRYIDGRRTSNRYILAGDCPLVDKSTLRLVKDEPLNRKNATPEGSKNAGYDPRKNAAGSRAIDPEQKDPEVSPKSSIEHDLSTGTVSFGDCIADFLNGDPA